MPAVAKTPPRDALKSGHVRRLGRGTWDVTMLPGVLQRWDVVIGDRQRWDVVTGDRERWGRVVTSGVKVRTWPQEVAIERVIVGDLLWDSDAVKKQYLMRV